MSSAENNVHERTPLPEGTIPVGIALLIAGVATYAFFKVGTVAVGGADEFAPIASMWFAVFALAPGFFLPLEQELGRALSHRRAIGDGGRPVVRRVVGLGGILVAVVTLCILALSPLIATSYFDGNWFMVVALIAAFAAYAPAHMARGVCSGSGRFREYAVIMGSDGIVRIVLCVVLAVVGVTAVGAYGLAIAISPLFAVAYVYQRKGLRTDPGPPAELREVTPNLGWLLIGSVCAATLLNAGPIAASLLAPDGSNELITAFSYGVLLSRIPLFLFQAVQAALLPRLSRQAARGEFGEFRSGLRRLMVVVGGVGLAGTIGAFVLGPWALRTRVRRRSQRPHARHAVAEQRGLHARAGHRAGGHRTPGPRARRPRLGGRTDHVPARHVAVGRRGLPADRDRPRAVVDRGAGGLCAGTASPPQRGCRANPVVDDGSHHRHALRDVTLLLSLTADD